MEVSTPSHLISAVIPGFEILEELGRGGMGVVYRARQTKLGRVVALKMIRSGLFASLQEQERFQSEARAVAKLQHPNIVQIFEVGEHREASGPTYPYMALEYVAGGSLSQEIRIGPLPSARAASVAETIARGLNHAHERGIVHRDLKPANILLSEDGTPKISDFGLAKHLDLSEEHTGTDQMLGTPDYMAPEQASGLAKSVGPAADIFALGAILYAMLSGKPPFKGTTLVETLEQVRSRDPAPLRQRGVQAPRDLETICFKCLEKSPARRYATAQDAADDLARFQRGEPILARPVGRVERAVRWARRYPAAAALLLVLIAATAGSAWGLNVVSQERDEKENQRGQAVNAEKRAQENERKEKEQRIKTQEALEETERQKSIAEGATKEAEAKRIIAEEKRKEAQAAAEAERKAKESLEVALYRARVLLADQYWLANNIPEAERNLLGCPEKLRNWEWHYLMRLCRGGGRTLTGTGSFSNVAFGRDAKTVFAIGPGQPMTAWSAADGTKLFALANPPPAHEYDAPVFLDAQGKRLLVPLPSVGPQFRNNKAVFEPAELVDAATGKPLKRLTADSFPGNRFAFAPDGKRVVGWGSGFGLTIWDLEIDGNGVGERFQNMQIERAVWAPNSESILILGKRGGKGIMVLFDLRQKKELFASELGFNVNFHSAQFSKDGSKLAAVGGELIPRIKEDLKKQGFLKLFDVPGGKETASFECDEEMSFVRLAPGDRYALAFSQREGVTRLCDFKEKTFEVVAKGQQAGNVSKSQIADFSPDGKLAAMAGFLNVRVMETDSRKIVHEFRGHATGAVCVLFSPDGKTLASGGDGVRLWNLGAGELAASLSDPVRSFDHATFVGDNAEIAVGKTVTEKNLIGEVSIWNRKLPDKTRLLTKLQQPVRIWTASKDGSMLAVGGNGPVEVIDTATGKQRTKILAEVGNSLPPTAIDFSPDGNTLALAEPVGQFTLRKASTGEELYRWSPSPDLKKAGLGTLPIWQLCFSRDGSLLAVGWTNEVKVFDLAAKKWVCAIPHGVHTHNRSLAFRGASKQLVVNAVAAFDATPSVKVFDTTDGTLLADLKGHLGRIHCITLTPDGDRLATAATDGFVKIWDLEERLEMLSLRGLYGPAVWVEFSRDGGQLATVFVSLDGREGKKSEVKILDGRP
jgi:WD40 repeat protein